MSRIPPDDPNFFEPPRAGIGDRVALFGGDSSDAEAIRRAHLTHEASIKSIGSLYYLGAILQGISLVLLVSNDRVDASNSQIISKVISVVLQFALGYGLTHLLVWARWIVLAFTVLGLVVVPLMGFSLMLFSSSIGAGILLVGESIMAYVAYLLISPKGGVVFSREYQDVIRKTPHIRYQTSAGLKIFLALIVILFIVGTAAYFSRTR